MKTFQMEITLPLLMPKAVGTPGVVSLCFKIAKSLRQSGSITTSIH
jgi:hypothetical protein